MPELALKTAHSIPIATYSSSKQRVRILFLIPSLRMGGAEIQLLTLAKGLDKARFEVTVAAFYRGQALDKDFAAVENVRIVYLDKKGFWGLGYLRRFSNLLKQGDFDILQAVNVSARLIGWLLARVHRIPVTILTERTAKLLYSSPGSRFYLALEKFAMRHCSVVVANSNAGCEFVIRRGVKPEQVKIISNGIDPQRLVVTESPLRLRQRYGIPSTSVVIGMIARLEAQKDPRTLITAAQALVHRFPSVYFLLVGDGPLFSAIRQLVSILGLQNRVILTGHQSQAADYLSAMDIAVLTSREVEGCSNFLLEAMALGKPVVATNVGGNGELVRDSVTGFLVPPGDPAALRERLARLLQDAQLCRQFGHEARRFVEQNFSLQAMTRAYQELYLELLAGITTKKEPVNVLKMQ